MTQEYATTPDLPNHETLDSPENERFLPPLRQPFVRALALTLVLTLVTGILFPLVLGLLGQLLFPVQAGGSLIRGGDQLVGAEWIGQQFTQSGYFWERPSATAPEPYNAAASVGSNLGADNPALADAVQVRIAALQAADPTNTLPIPIDLITASGSGLDPHVSPAAAYYQVNRVAAARGVAPDAVRALVDDVAEGRQFGFLGEPRVNVLRLNQRLDEQFGPLLPVSSE